ncbi:three component ABC system middle component [Pseudomonas sp. GD03766]|uniref:three component ABC system middle component n=1 Tax=Pseudomonas TaxID=286 RepID=UPI00244A8B44|nr:three component ABC system middle component [Pseudomonas sp. GD03766]MDH1692591.1 DUF6521 family protein [Pseudomonas sp. GD03766]
MKIAHDLYAETNPAFCAYLLATFAEAYGKERGSNPDMVLCFTALPIALSGDLDQTFHGTNRLTGLLEWVQRNPIIQIDLSERINASAEIVSEAIQYGCFSKLVQLDSAGKVLMGAKRTNKSAILRLSAMNINAFKRARLLGHWMAMSGSTRTTLNMMGLTV